MLVSKQIRAEPCFEPYYESEAKCKAFHVKINYVRSLAFKIRFNATLKWRIKCNWWGHFVTLTRGRSLKTWRTAAQITSYGQDESRLVWIHINSVLSARAAGTSYIKLNGGRNVKILNVTGLKVWR